MFIRAGEISDLDDILSIFEEARAFMRTSGNMTQWTNGYPSRDVILQDIRAGYCFVCVEDGTAAAVFSLIDGEDPTYGIIDGGSWLNDRPYATVHRMAVRVRNKGVAAFCLEWCFERCRNLRIDTHEDNIPMRRLVEKCGFQYCGIIYLPNGSPRLAYQKSK